MKTPDYIESAKHFKEDIDSSNSIISASCNQFIPENHYQFMFIHAARKLKDALCNVMCQNLL